MTQTAAYEGKQTKSPAATKTAAYAALSAKTPIEPFEIERRAPKPNDVAIEILYCGVCHSDIHQARDEWGGSIFPMVPGHEIVGRVTSVGSAVTKFKAGDLAGVGCMVDSCRVCANCRDGEEQYCNNPHSVYTYNGREKTGEPTYGGYSTSVVVDESFVLHISSKLDLAATAPLLCAGITTYSPLKHWNVGKGTKLGVMGLGGLGHMGLKFGHAFGAHVVQFTTSPNKVADARKLGADEVVISTDAKQMGEHAGTFDFILDTISAPHDIAAYLNLLKRDGVLCMVGAPDEPLSVPVFSLLGRRASLAGSGIGGIRETQEMLDYCAEHGIVSDIEMIPIQKINEAYERMLKNDVKYRFVIDIESLKTAATQA
ncbi:MAG TPA: NAD(P)-dependent alcohol dehydrogenase [Gemmatimonadaceae bacterium]|nr:NAD(P)-dependent alcohol dehydrogenase [Gemmatimonadaceae bacterium]